MPIHLVVQMPTGLAEEVSELVVGLVEMLCRPEPDRMVELIQWVAVAAAQLADRLIER